MHCQPFANEQAGRPLVLLRNKSRRKESVEGSDVGGLFSEISASEAVALIRST